MKAFRLVSLLVVLTMLLGLAPVGSASVAPAATPNLLVTFPGGYVSAAGFVGWFMPICTSPEANARTTDAPLSNLRQSTFAPLALAKVLSACATFAGSAEV